MDDKRVLILFIAPIEETDENRKRTYGDIKKYRTVLQSKQGVFVSDKVHTLQDNIYDTLDESVAGFLDGRDKLKAVRAKVNKNGNAVDVLMPDHNVHVVCCLVLTTGLTRDGVAFYEKVTARLQEKYLVKKIAVGPSVMLINMLETIVPHYIPKVDMPKMHKTFMQVVLDIKSQYNLMCMRNEKERDESSDVARPITSSDHCLKVAIPPSHTYKHDTKHCRNVTKNVCEPPHWTCSYYPTTYDVSDESGKGTSLDSHMFVPLHDCHDDNENDVNGVLLQGISAFPSDDISFIPPDPSVLSGEDHADGLVALSDVAKTDGNESLNTVMSKLAAINSKHKTDECYSLYSGNV